MSITVQKSNQLKSIAILMLLFTHLFNRNYIGVYEPLIFIGGKPLSLHLSVFTDIALPIFAFVSGYGLYYSYNKNPIDYFLKNIERVKKLYTRYWIILLIFAVILGLVFNVEGYPGSFLKFILNFTAIDPTYNSAWWFFTIYVLFVFTSRLWFKCLDSYNPYVLLCVFITIYFISFYFRVYKTDIFEGSFLNLLHKQGALYFATLFQFMLGAFSLKYDWSGKVQARFNKIKYVNLTVLLGVVILIVIRGTIPNSILAPFTGLGFIFLFLQINLNIKVERILDFFNPHSTNLWLVHTFIYAVYCREIIFGAKYTIPIFLWLILWCLVSSYLVNFANRFIQKRL